MPRPLLLFGRHFTLTFIFKDSYHYFIVSMTLHILSPLGRRHGVSAASAPHAARRLRAIRFAVECHGSEERLAPRHAFSYLPNRWLARRIAFSPLIADIYFFY